MAILNTYCSVAALVSTQITGLILDMGPQPQSMIPTNPYDMVFITIAAVNMFGTIVYLIFAKGTAQFT
jgi:hypothetical protein